ncbi:MAG: MBL fold metallo-hydrolase [Actinobacteria bacterium]|nr:MBL fold metallo-hydrolase [Actinomycetota bacterium]MBU1943514.1 MBL fold metallo-hydrolase [Actinomycetota bacterium]MBU2686469.1 MBL fold metallo-hydrolase [Actinomycetota bacterium]
MEVKVTILCDNLAGPVSFKGEHGLAVLVEVEGKSFLWDCGQSDVAVHNAKISGLDLRKFDGIGISHGHFDHAGGLMEVLSAAGPKKLFMHPKALEPKFFMAGNIKRFIGIPFQKEAIQSACADVVISSDALEVLPGVRLTGEVPRVTDFEGFEANLYCRTDGEIRPDPFTDDQSLVVDTPDGAIVLTGCAHSGLVNVLKHVLRSSGKIKAVIGGTHLGLGASPERIDATLDFLEEILPERIVPCHCTGMNATIQMVQRLKDRVIPGQTGMMISL